MSKAVLEAVAVSKSFRATKALTNVSMRLVPGTVHGLVGENGAGKSTLISIFSGSERPDKGEIRVDGEAIAFPSPRAAKLVGVSVIYQELSLVPWLTVAANIVLGQEPCTRAWLGGVLSNRRAFAIASHALSEVGADDISPETITSSLSPARMQLVEIARAVAARSRVVIMDEPTSSLPRKDANRVVSVIQALRAQGKAVLFVSHHLDEVCRVADAVTVLRAGEVSDEIDGPDVNPRRLIASMLGRPAASLYPEIRNSQSELVLEVKHLTGTRAFSDISFTVRAGEILGFYGLIGAGRTELMRALVGADDTVVSGSVVLHGTPISMRSVGKAIRSGVMYLPEDRKLSGLVLTMSGRENVTLASLCMLSTFGVVRRAAARRAADAAAHVVGVRGNLDADVVNLSGGNQQKIVVARGLLSKARLLIFDEPTRGIDIGAKYDIYVLLQKLAEQGAAIILVSSELPEIMHVTHRAIVMSRGRIYGEFSHEQYNENVLLSAAFSGFRDRGASVSQPISIVKSGGRDDC